MERHLVGVHGILNYGYLRRSGSLDTARRRISADWTEWFGADVPIDVAYYAHHLHRGTPQGDDDVEQLEEAAQDMLVSWVEELREGSPVPQGPRTARARAAADWLTRRFGPTARLVVFALVRELAGYLRSPDSARRASARAEVAAAVAARSGPATVIAHSLGSVVAYEALWGRPDLTVDLFVTLGSPLGMPSVVHDRLVPSPFAGRGARPPNVARWINLADTGDIVAVPRTGLTDHFDGVDEEDISLRIADWDFHTAKSYLRCPNVSRRLLA